MITGGGHDRWALLLVVAVLAAGAACGGSDGGKLTSGAAGMNGDASPDAPAAGTGGRTTNNGGSGGAGGSAGADAGPGAGGDAGLETTGSGGDTLDAPAANTDADAASSGTDATADAVSDLASAVDADAPNEAAATVDADAATDSAAADSVAEAVRRDGGDAQKLGGPCRFASDCAAGLTCLAETGNVFYGAGGAAHGYCSSPCQTVADANLCNAAGGLCVDVGNGVTPVGYCLLACTEGDSGAVVKCGGRPDVACTALQGSGAACLPTCSQDSDCTVGRKCDDLLSVCVDTPRAGSPFGSHCPATSVGTAADPCAGACLPVGGTAAAPAASFCTRTCVAGFLNQCNWVPAGTALATGGPHGVCLPLTDTAGPGDLGLCLQLCETAADCGDQSDPGLLCDRSQVAVIGHGVCNWAAP